MSLILPNGNQSSQSDYPGGLRREDFRPLILRGWDQPHNDYIYSMAWFEGRLYCGTLKGMLVFIRQRNPPPKINPYPIRVPDNPFSVDVRAQIWCYTPESDSWEMVYQAPMVIGRFGETVTREIGYRGMAVFQGKSDRRPALYVSTISPSRSTGPLILRSEDGKHFEPATDSGLGLGIEGLKSFRFLEIFNGKLYTSPIGGAQKTTDPNSFANSVVNSSASPIVFESDDPATGKWRPISPPHFGNANNAVVFYSTAFNDHLYAGTFNIVSGFQIWKTKAEGEPPYTWTNVLRLGAYRGKLNQGIIWMCPFKGALYACTGIQDGGYDRKNRIGPAAGEVIRIYPDDSWDLVVGTPRLTPQGLKLPVSGLRPGFDNFFNGYLWQMCVHDNWLYLGTMDWSVYLRYAPLEEWHPAIRALVVESKGGVEAVIEQQGGFDLWKTNDGNHWYPVTITGFDNPYNCGIRKLLSTPIGFAVGTVNPFGPDVATKVDGQWDYIHNPRGGAEVWLAETKPEQLPVPQQSRPLELTHVDMSEVKDSISADFPLSQKPVYLRQKQIDALPYQVSKQQLNQLKRLIDVNAIVPETIDFYSKYHALEIVGLDKIPQQSPVLFACNHASNTMLVESIFFSEDVLLSVHILSRYLKQPPRTLVSLIYYDSLEFYRIAKSVFNKLGCVPITVENGVRLLDMGEPVIIFPEDQGSKPVYRTLPFFWDFAKMAWISEAPIVPTVLIGPHESRFRIDCGDSPIVFIPQRNPNVVVYKFIFLPPINIRQYVQKLEDRTALSNFCEMVRQRIQTVLDRESVGRPLIQAAQRLQDKYGSP
jgi:1-acyl-sn-glycerol-3-phosphate acyltransferase